MRRLSGFALALVAALAMGALAAACAGAVVLRAGEYPATLDGASVKAEPTNFKFGEIEFICEKTTLGGTLEKESSTVLIQRSYSQCVMIFGEATVPATIKVNGCAFELHLLSKLGQDLFDSKVDVVCEGSAGIEFFGYSSVSNHEKGVPVCVFEILPQKGLEKVELADMTEKEPFDVTVQPRVKGMLYKRLSGVLCGPKEGTASYIGNTTATATSKEGKVISLWVE